MSKITRVKRLESEIPEGASPLYPKWQALGLLLELREGHHAASLYREGKIEELKALFIELKAPFDGKTPPIFWDLRNIDEKQIEWGVQQLGKYLEWVESWHE